jgi:hypothetical protein
MSQATKRALVLHVTSGEAVLFGVSQETADELLPRLPDLMATGSVETLTGADGTPFVVNFRHVVTAHVGPLPPLAHVYGTTGFK